MGLSDVVRNCLNREIKAKYPHIEYPSALYAEIVKKQAVGSAYNYSLRLLTAGLQIDSTIPEIPNVKSKVSLDVGDIAAVVLPYGQMLPFIVGEAVV